jgi:predicted esterase
MWTTPRRAARAVHFLLACSMVLAGLAARNARAQDGRAERPERKPALADLARSYLALEQAVQAHGYGRVGRERANAEFDQLTMGFFLGSYGSAVERLDALVAAIDPLRADPRERAADALVVVCERRWRAPGATRLELYLARNHAGHDLPADFDEVVLVEALPIDGAPGWSARLRHADIGGGLSALPPLELDAAVDLRVTLRVGEAAPREAWTCEWLPRAPSAISAALLERLAGIEPDGPPLEQAKASLQARAKRLRDRLDPGQPASILLSPRREQDELETDVAQLERGVDPLRRRVGDHWRVVQAGKRAFPLRVLAPPAAAKDEPLPLVVALHGAGGDEHHWFEAYGAGRLARLAREDGVLLVAPATGMGGLRPEEFDQLLVALVYCYAIDRARIHVVGHSMGAGLAANLAKERGARLASVACFAGGPRGAPPTSTTPPILVVAGARDAIVPYVGVRQAALAWREAGLPVEFRGSEDEGHTLLVAEHLAEAWAWMRSKSR